VLGNYTETFSNKTKYLKYFPLTFNVFLFILCCNLIGMVPFSFTSTSQISITFALGLTIFMGLTLKGILKNRIHFLSLFFPASAPIALAPLLVPIEILSYFIRGFSISIRLFANMMAGHALLKILAGFS
jgi:F-type H+-transporting ATPase subunit a